MPEETKPKVEEIKKPVITRELKKTEDNEYTLKIDDTTNRHYTTVILKKDKLREIYLQLVTHKVGVLNNLNNVKSQLKKIDVEDSPELRKLMIDVKKLEQLNKKMELENQLSSLENELNKSLSEMKEITNVMPELLRSKK
uniref:Uncharacterized protein n=1 Tax=viral metagenome TaxID=1070528 RepID=A0A6M3JKE9_9ZZZZ